MRPLINCLMWDTDLDFSNLQKLYETAFEWQVMRLNWVLSGFSSISCPCQHLEPNKTHSSTNQSTRIWWTSIYQSHSSSDVIPCKSVSHVWSEEWCRQLSYPITPQAGAGGFSLDSAEEGQMKVFSKDEQQQALHPLGSHLRDTQVTGHDQKSIWADDLLSKPVISSIILLMLTVCCPPPESEGIPQATFGVSKILSLFNFFDILT